MKQLFVILAFPTIVTSASGAEKETAYGRVMRTGVLRCGYINWPPFFSMDPNTKILTGVGKDLSDAAMRILNLKIEYIDVVNGGQVEDFNTGKIDAMCGDGPWVLSTVKFLDYSTPYLFAPVYVYVRANEKRFTAPDDLNRQDVTFTAIDGDLSTDLVLTNFPKAKLASLGSNGDPSQMLLNVVTGKADAVVVDPVTVADFSKNNPGKIKQLFTSPLAVYGDGFSVKKGETALLTTLSQAVDAVLNAGQAERILAKYDPKGVAFLPVIKPYKEPK